MSAQAYLDRIQEILGEIKTNEMRAIQAAAKIMAGAIRKKGRVYMFGSGHSVIPVLDIFPRYGSFVGFFPLYDPRLMWSNVIGPGGARELLWLERQEGYAKVFLQSYPLEKRDVMLVFSHGGLNAAGIDMALEAKARGLKVVTVSSHANIKIGKRSHSSGKILSEIADVAIDNHVPPEDALVDVGQLERVAAGSTVAAVAIAMSPRGRDGRGAGQDGQGPADLRVAQRPRRPAGPHGRRVPSLHGVLLRPAVQGPAQGLRPAMERA